MKVIIAGGRDLTVTDDFLDKALEDSGFNNDDLVILDGGAPGIDTCARNWAKRSGYDSVTFWANWKRYRRSAGPIRNRRMGGEADALILIWNGKSTGSQSMKNIAIELGLKIHEVIV